MATQGTTRWRLGLGGLLMLAFGLAGCSGGFQAGDDDDNDGDPDASGGGQVNVDDEDNDGDGDRDSPGVGALGIVMVLATVGFVLYRRR